jgi:DNA-binding response OmpR family regulator
MKRPRTSVRPVSVLVVDGYPDAAASLAFVLNREGFSARAALSGEEALAAAAAEPPEVVIVEPRTPGGGWDLARRLALPAVGERPLVVALTTDTTAAGREAANSAGVSLYLVKPESPTVLVRALRRVGRTGRGSQRRGPGPARGGRAPEGGCG